MQKTTHYELQTDHYKTLHTAFINYLKTLGYSPSSVNSLPVYVKEFLYCQEQKRNTLITNITSLTIRQHYQYLQNRPNKTRGGGLSSSMIATHLFALKLFFNSLEQTAILQNNPLSSLKFPSPEYRHRTALTRQEIDKLYQVAETFRDKALLGLFYGCGLRRAEAENLNTKEVKLRENLLIIREGKGSKRRVVPLADKVKTALENYYHYERPSYEVKDQEAFMINNKGRRMTRNNYYPRIKHLAQKAEIPRFCLHQLRHSIATHLLEQGMKIEKVRNFLGHKSIDTTQRYTYSAFGNQSANL
jgi:integrase/recombinase XerD